MTGYTVITINKAGEIVCLHSLISEARPDSTKSFKFKRFSIDEG